MEATGEDAVKIVEMTPKALEYATHSVDKAAARGQTLMSKKVPWVRRRQAALQAAEKLWKEESAEGENFIVVLS